MRRFATLSARDVAVRIDSAGAHARAAMMRHNCVQLIPAPRPRRGAWSHRPSVLTFAVRGPDGLLSAAALRPLYLALAGDLSGRLPGRSDAASRMVAAQRCLLGQPVQLGGPGIGGLRVAFSAAQVAGGDDLRPALSAVFGKLALILQQGLA
jgi:hypothetical protein